MFVVNWSKKFEKDEAYVQQYIADELSEEEWNNLYKWVRIFWRDILEIYYENGKNTPKVSSQLYKLIKNIYTAIEKKQIFNIEIINSALENFNSLDEIGVDIKEYKFLKILLKFAALKDKSSTTKK